MLVNNLHTHVLDYGQGKKTILILHGWGGSSASMLVIGNDLSSKYRVIIPDLWGFGQSQDPSSHFGIYDYADCVANLLLQKGLNNVIVVGHSFGGRIGIILASKYKNLVSKLILIDSAGAKPRFSLIKYLKIKRYKHIKRQVQNGQRPQSDLKKFGSPDYLALNDNNKQVFVRVVNQHLDGLFGQIKQPTLIIWGKKDNQTPLYMAKLLHKQIKCSKIVLIKGGHFAYIKQKVKVLESIYQFLEDE